MTIFNCISFLFFSCISRAKALKPHEETLTKSTALYQADFAEIHGVGETGTAWDYLGAYMGWEDTAYMGWEDTHDTGLALKPHEETLTKSTALYQADAGRRREIHSENLWDHESHLAGYVSCDWQGGVLNPDCVDLNSWRRRAAVWNDNWCFPSDGHYGGDWNNAKDQCSGHENCPDHYNCYQCKEVDCAIYVNDSPHVKDENGVWHFGKKIQIHKCIYNPDGCDPKTPTPTPGPTPTPPTPSPTPSPPTPSPTPSPTPHPTPTPPTPGSLSPWISGVVGNCNFMEAFGMESLLSTYGEIDKKIGLFSVDIPSKYKSAETELKKLTPEITNLMKCSRLGPDPQSSDLKEYAPLLLEEVDDFVTKLKVINTLSFSDVQAAVDTVQGTIQTAYNFLKGPIGKTTAVGNKCWPRFTKFITKISPIMSTVDELVKLVLVSVEETNRMVARISAQLGWALQFEPKGCQNYGDVTDCPAGGPSPSQSDPADVCGCAGTAHNQCTGSSGLDQALTQNVDIYKALGNVNPPSTPISGFSGSFLQRKEARETPEGWVDEPDTLDPNPERAPAQSDPARISNAHSSKLHQATASHGEDLENSRDPPTPSPTPSPTPYYAAAPSESLWSRKNREQAAPEREWQCHNGSASCYTIGGHWKGKKIRRQRQKRMSRDSCWGEPCNFTLGMAANSTADTDAFEALGLDVTLATMKIDVDFNYYLYNVDSFEADFVKGVAECLGIDSDRVVILSVIPGSIDIKFKIIGANGEDSTKEMAELDTQLTTSGSILQKGPFGKYARKASGLQDITKTKNNPNAGGGGFQNMLAAAQSEVFSAMAQAIANGANLVFGGNESTAVMSSLKRYSDCLQDPLPVGVCVATATAGILLEFCDMSDIMDEWSSITATIQSVLGIVYEATNAISDKLKIINDFLIEIINPRGVNPPVDAFTDMSTECNVLFGYLKKCYEAYQSQCSGDTSCLHEEVTESELDPDTDFELQLEEDESSASYDLFEFSASTEYEDEQTVSNVESSFAGKGFQDGINMIKSVYQILRTVRPLLKIATGGCSQVVGTAMAGNSPCFTHVSGLTGLIARVTSTVTAMANSEGEEYKKKATEAINLATTLQNKPKRVIELIRSKRKCVWSK